MTVAAILLAARRTSAASAPFAHSPAGADETLVEWQVAQLLEAGVDVVEVVVGYEAERVIPLVARDNVEPIVHAAWAQDESGAVRIGATAVPRDTHTAIIVDLACPTAADSCEALLRAHAEAGRPITRASYEGVPGWPIVADAGALAEIRNASDERGGLEAILHRHEHETQYVELPGA